MTCLICKKHRPYNLDPHLPMETCIMYGGTEGHSGYVAKSRIPLEYAFNIYEDLDFQPDMFRAYMESFPKLFRGEKVRNLFLWSKGTGLGKTFTASALLNEFSMYHVLRNWVSGNEPVQVPTYFLDLNELQRLYNTFNRPNVDASMAQQASAVYYHKLKQAETALMTVIDDIGVRDATDGFRSDIHTLINHRALSQTPTIYTSNHPMEDLEVVYDKRIFDRIRDNTVVINFDSVGNSRRGL